MSGFAAEEQAVHERISTEWAGTEYAAVPIIRENFVHNREKEQIPYLTLTIQDGSGDRIYMPPRAMDRFVGVILFQIFVRGDTGTRYARQLADAVADIFRCQSFDVTGSGMIHCRTPSIQTIGAESGWYQVNVNVPFERDKFEE